MINRRRFLGVGLASGVTLALTPEIIRALHQPGASLIEKRIPSSGEMIPALGLSFSNHPGCADHTALKEVVKAFADSGARVYDVLHVNPANEQFHIAAASELGVQNKFFWSTRGNPANVPPKAELVKPHIASLLARLKTSRIDLAMVPVASDSATIAALKAEKKAGRVRYIGVQTIVVSAQAARLEEIMRSEPIDFIGVDYDVSNRFVEQKILPLAQQRKIAVMAFFPFNNASGLSCTGGTSLFTRTANRPLPAWAAEFDAKSWAQFFLKYVISHPAITVARTGTTKASHMVDNLGGGIGRLPDAAMRERMAELVDSLPPVTLTGPSPQVLQGPPGAIVLGAAILDRYVGEYKTPGGGKLTFRRYGTLLTATVAPDPETVIYAFSETRFSIGSNFIEFQVDQAGRCIGLVMEQGSQRIPAARTR